MVTRRPVLGWLLRASVTAAALVLVARLVGADALRAGTAVLAPGPVAVALLLGLLWRALAAARWLVVARALGAPLGRVQAFAEYQRSELVNQVLPGAVVGDVDRARRHGQDVGLLPAARAVALERVAGQVVLVAAAVVALAAQPGLLGVARGVDGRTVAVAAAVVGLVGAAGVLLWQPWRRRRVAKAVAAAVPVTPRARPGRGGVAGTAVAALGLSVGVLGCFVTLFVVAAHATGPDTAPERLVPAVLLVLVLAGVPLTVAGWGAREAGAALCFAAVGLAAADGVAAAVGYGLLSLVSALPGLVPLLLPRLRTPARRPSVAAASDPSRTGARQRLRRASAAPAPAPPRSPDRSAAAGR